MKKFLSNPCNIYTLLWVLYSIQGTIINTGGTRLSQILMLLLVLMGLYYTFRTLGIPNKPVYFRGLNLLFLMFFVYGVLLMFSDHQLVIKAKMFDNKVPNYNYLKQILMSLPNIYAFYYFGKRGFLTESYLRKWVVVFFFVAIFRYFDFQIGALQTASLMGLDVEEATNNMGYLFATLIPSVVLFHNSVRKQYALLIVCMAFLLLGMKRGAILVGALSLIYFMFFNYKYNGNISRGKLIFFSLIIIIAGYLLVNYMMNSSDYFIARVNATLNGETSSRNDIYNTFYQHFKNESDPFIKLFGNGADATLRIGVNYAHNDWLEIAINQGILGLIIYAIYWLCFLRTIKISSCNIQAKLVFGLTFISFFVKTIFSMSYTGYSIMASSVFGFYLATYNKQGNLC